MSFLDVPRLYRNRCGVFCFRLRAGARDQRVSLGTKSALTAHMIASKINAAVSSARAREHGMTGKNPTLAELGLDLDALRKYEVDLRAGTVKTDGTKADHDAAMAAIDRIGLIPGGWPPKPTDPLAADLALIRAANAERDAALPPTVSPPAMPSRSLASIAGSWIAERRQKNKERTVYAKECHYGNFCEHLASVANLAAFDKDELAAFKKREQNAAKERAEASGKSFRKITDKALDGMFVAAKTSMASLGKQSAVDFKQALLASGQKAKTVDNKLLTLSDLFEYAMGNGAYKAADGANPVSGTYILTKNERMAKAEPYKPFTPDDLSRIFEPAAYKAKMSEPDFYWCPLIALHSGMRISEATGIHCADVLKDSDGVDYIHVRKSKTGAGVRDVPIAQALINLGLLSFVASQRADGHDRLFPDRMLINDSYSKELGIAFREHLIAVSVRKLSDASERKSFHSFRVNVITQLADNGANTIQVMKIVGHSAGQAQALSTHLGYVRQLHLKPIVDGLVWPIDLVGLKKP
jgi:integrase